MWAIGPTSASIPSRWLRPSAALWATAAVLLGACGFPPSGGPAAVKGRGVVDVVAAENVWGSIAAQVGGRHVQVTSIVTNPDTDPHSYEPTAADAEALASAQLVIENGAGYDPWVPKLLAADPGQPTVLDVGDLVGVQSGGNPHRWYNPADVQAVVARLAGDLQDIDPADGDYFAAQAVRFETVSMRPYTELVAGIRAKYAGTPVGASESIFAMLSPALGLDLVTPPTFLRAVSEGTEVSAADKSAIDRQIEERRIKIYVYNSQNVTPDVQAQLSEVRSEHIPYATITETLVPARATYQAWQTEQLTGIERALARATGSRR